MICEAGETGFAHNPSLFGHVEAALYLFRRQNRKYLSQTGMRSTSISRIFWGGDDEHFRFVNCKGLPPLHYTLFKVNIKYEYYVRTNIIFAEFYPSK